MKTLLVLTILVLGFVLAAFGGEEPLATEPPANEAAPAVSLEMSVFVVIKGNQIFFENFSVKNMAVEIMLKSEMRF